MDANDAKGWLVGTTKTPMKDWRAVIRTWKRNAKDGAVKGQKSSLINTHHAKVRDESMHNQGF